MLFTSRTPTFCHTQTAELLNAHTKHSIRHLAETLELFEGDQAAAEHWFQTPVRGLRYRTPAELVETAEGVAQVRTLIGRLEHGVIT